MFNLMAIIKQTVQLSEVCVRSQDRGNVNIKPHMHTHLKTPTHRRAMLSVRGYLAVCGQDLQLYHLLAVAN